MTPEDLAAIREESEIEHAPDVCYEDWRRHVMGLLEHIDSQADEIKRLEEALVEERGKLFHQFGEVELDKPSESDCKFAREQLRAEGVIR